VRLALVAAAGVVTVTLVDDALQPSILSHPRPPVIYVLAAVLAGALLVLAPRARSRPIALGAGIAAGGALATLVGGAVWAGGVPNPLAAHGVAFNVADLAIGVGDALLIGGALLHARLHRHRLRDAI
jgi:lipoprotein signal peptidase